MKLCLSPLLLVAVAHAGEVHTRQTAGTWTSDVQRGTLRGYVPNDAGYSFWLLAEQVDQRTPFTIVAQIRFASRIDYGGAGVAIIDPGASGQAQKHLRIELSERDDTAGVGGWLGNENHFSGASRRAGRDIKVNEWYELKLEVDGAQAVGYLDGLEVFNAKVPELAQLPQTLTLAPFVYEADVEIRVHVKQRPAPVPPTPDPKPVPDPKPDPKPAGPAAKIGWIEPWGKDETDGSDVRWATTLPKPSLGDDPKKGGVVHAEWTSSYEVKGDRVCVRVASLRAPTPSTHQIAIGYTVTLDNAIFDNGSRTKTIIVTRFTGMPERATAGACEPIVVGGTPTVTTTTTVKPVDPYGGMTKPPMPASGRVADMLPASSKKQVEIEKLFAQKVEAVTGPDDYRKMYDSLDELIFVTGTASKPFHFLLEPVSRQWHFYNRLHDTWEPTGYFAGEATFAVVKGKVKVTSKKKKGKK